MKLATAEQMRTIDKLAINELKIPGVVLMENAGRGTALLIDEHFADEADEGVLILCGPGNNGGDGYVIARHLANMGYDVMIAAVGNKPKAKSDARTNRNIAEKMELPLLEVRSKKAVDELEELLVDCGLVVDAMFGTGLSRAIEGLSAEVIELVNEFGMPVVAVDIPSGLSADTGKPTGPAIPADMTCTYGLAKIGQFLHPGADLCGEVRVVDISIPPEVVERVYIPANLTGPLDVLPLFSPRPSQAHKGNFGHALVVGGSRGMSGAPIMTAQAAVSAGAGLVTLAVPESLLTVAECSVLEALKSGLPDAGGSFDAAAVEQALALSESMNVIALGPGIGRAAGAVELVQAMIGKVKAPLVIDADGINAIAGDLSVLAQAQGDIILTPHPGEMARLLDTTTEQVQNDRIGCAIDFARIHGVVVVLKGAQTIVADPDGMYWINPTGNAGMASGGMGDVLTGLIAGLIAQGAHPTHAAVAGAYLHGIAGDIARDKVGEKALTAGSVLKTMPDVFKAIEEMVNPTPEDDEE